MSIATVAPAIGKVRYYKVAYTGTRVYHAQ
jgi:hypothetical protein